MDLHGSDEKDLYWLIQFVSTSYVTYKKGNAIEEGRFESLKLAAKKGGDLKKWY